MRGDIQDRARRALRERERRAALKAGGVKRKRTDEERARHAEQERERRKIQSPETKRRSVEWHRKDREKNRERYRAYQRDFQRRRRRAKMIADGLNPNNPREAQNRYSATHSALETLRRFCSTAPSTAR
jgi:hypothetical protein